jgi:hypothetical protein
MACVPERERFFQIYSDLKDFENEKGHLTFLFDSNQSELKNW